MDEDLLADDRPKEERDNLFGWTVLILLLIGCALASWLGTYYIFGHPENPRSYKLLLKLKKIEAPKRFEVTAAPPGEFLTAAKLYGRYITYPHLKLQDENHELLRIYINNYQETKRLVPYVVGRYTILSSRPLNAGDIFTTGMVALAQSIENPSVLIEYIYPCPAASVMEVAKTVQPGVTLELKRTVDLSAILHIERIEGRLQVTLMPLLYGSYALKEGEGSFNLEPPPGLNIAAGVPVIKLPEMQDTIRAYAGNPIPGEAAVASAATPAKPPELIRVDSNPPPGVSVAMAAPVSTPTVPEASAAPAPPAEMAAAATPVPEPSAAAPEPSAIPTPVEIVMNATPAPIVPTGPPAPPRAEAVATPVPVSSDGAPLQPFLVAKTAPAMPSTEATWRTYAPGLMPRGRLVESDELSGLADRTVGGERLYIRGEFVVTASEANRAVLRVRGSLGGSLERLVKPAAGSPRIIVEFPSGAVPPAEGSDVTRDETRPFLITDVRRGADGEINVYAREVTATP